MLNAAGGLDALPIVNVPGYPVALVGNAELLTLEPGPALAGTAQLHRLRLGAQGATILSSRSLEARVGAVRVVGAEDSSIVLELSGRSFARVSLDAAGNPSLTSFETAPSFVSDARFDDGVVRALGGAGVVRIPL